MREIKSILSKYIGDVELGGGSETDYSQLLKDLDVISKKNDKRFKILLYLGISLFIISILLLFISLNNITLLKAISTFMGVSVFGIVVFLSGIIKKKTYVDLLMALIKNELNNEVLKTTLYIIRKNLT